MTIWSASWALDALGNLCFACNRPFVLLHHFFKGLHHIIMCIGIQLSSASPCCFNLTITYNMCSNSNWYLELQHFMRVQECIKNLFCILVLGNVQSKEDYFNIKPSCSLIVQHSKDKTRHYKGSPKDHLCLDLILADIPEGLHVLGISNPLSSIPAWNQESKEWLQPLFDFVNEHLYDDQAIILFHPFRMSPKSNILGYCNSYGFAIRK